MFGPLLVGRPRLDQVDVAAIGTGGLLIRSKDLLVDLFTVHRDISRCFDTDAHLVVAGELGQPRLAREIRFVRMSDAHLTPIDREPFGSFFLRDPNDWFATQALLSHYCWANLPLAHTSTRRPL